jgi:hypothetical protein
MCIVDLPLAKSEASTLFGGGAAGYTDYPELPHELERDDASPITRS